MFVPQQRAFGTQYTAAVALGLVALALAALLVSDLVVSLALACGIVCIAFSRISWHHLPRLSPVTGSIARRNLR